MVDEPASGEELLKFPTDYPIKVVGRPSAEFRAHIHAIVVRHVPGVETDRISERLSENGNFLSISCAEGDRAKSGETARWRQWCAETCLPMFRRCAEMSARIRWSLVVGSK